TSPFEHYNVYLDEVFCGSTNDNFWIFSGLETNVTYLVSITAQYTAGESLPVTIEVIILGNDDPVHKPYALNNFPNPFNTSTQIQFTLDKAEDISLEIYNLKGQLIKTLYQGKAETGIHTLTWNGKDNNGNLCSGGVYFYKMQTRDRVLVKKMLMIK
ncbi:MAG TPA: FlgD immunoglobulin-like domain containing protein, partial [Candidatus Syntrophosphaera thermopropionivorans]|nr:FlgD immunoglobulin-like domain containing protein [Candidatus Syntrophosphaera thermopropionivorans]